jgi:hypothetical protein
MKEIEETAERIGLETPGEVVIRYVGRTPP